MTPTEMFYDVTVAKSEKKQKENTTNLNFNQEKFDSRKQHDESQKY